MELKKEREVHTENNKSKIVHTQTYSEVRYPIGRRAVVRVSVPECHQVFDSKGKFTTHMTGVKLRE